MNQQKFENFSNAINRLGEAVNHFKKDTNNSIYRDALIQRFEFSFELAWKCLAEYLFDQGINLESKTPRTVLKEAFEARIISDENLWLEILQSRNLMSHTYNEHDATEIAKKITKNYYELLKQLSNRIGRLNSN